jgi:hypothetical protein
MKLKKLKTYAFAAVFNFSTVVSTQLKFVDTNWWLVFCYLIQFLNRVETCIAKLKFVTPNKAILDTLSVASNHNNSRFQE